MLHDNRIMIIININNNNNNNNNRLVFSQSKVRNFFMYIILGKNYVLVAHGN